MRDHDAQRGMALEHARDAGRTVVRIGRPRDRADVHEHEALVLGDGIEHRREARIVERQMLHVLVDLEAGAAVAQRVAHVARRIGIVQMHGRQRHRAGPRSRAVSSSHALRSRAIPALCAYEQNANFSTPCSRRIARDLARLGRVLEHPGAALGEPAPDRREQPRRVQMRVDVDHRAA